MFGGVLLLLALVVLVIVVPIVSLVRVARLTAEVQRLTARISALEAGQGAPARRTVAEALVERTERLEAASEPPKDEEAPPPERAEEEPVGEEPEMVSAPVPWQAAPPAPADQAAKPAAASTDQTTAPAARLSGWEERIASSWMIWLGGLTVALAAVFLFRYAIDQGWLTPLTRVILGLTLGGLLLAAGEWTERAPVAGTERVVNPDYVPPALTASGIFAVFVSIFAAHALYGLLGPAGAFVALGLTAYSALVLSLRQGWFVALLGLLAGYLVPAMVSAPEPNALATFVYLFVLTLGALALMVWRRWRWFSVLAIAGALFWPWLWSLTAWTMADQGILGAYLLGLAAAFAGLSTRLPALRAGDPALQWIGGVLAQSSGIGFAATGALLVHLGLVADFNAAAFAFLVFYAVIALVMGLWRANLEGLFAVAALVTVATALIWPQPWDVSAPTRVQELGVEPVTGPFGPYVMPPEFFAFSRALWAFAAVFGLGGFFGLRRVMARAVWAGLSAFLPVVLFAVAYWRIGAFEISIDWAWWALGLAILELLAATAIARGMAGEARNVPLALYAAGVTAAVALAFTCLLREAWLTVALAAEVTALAWIWTRLRVDELKTIALTVLAVVVIRLVSNPMVLDYEGGFLGLFGWVVYGYGLPAVAMLAAARLFRAGGRDLTVTLSEIAAAGFAFLMVSLQLKLWTSGTIYSADFDFLDAATQVNWLIVTAALLFARPFSKRRPWAQVAGGIALALAAIVLGLVLLVARNPLFVTHWVGRWPVLNLLGLAYLVPAVLFFVLAASRRFALPANLRPYLFVASGVLVFVDLTLEVRRAFQGTVIALRWDTAPTNAEIYTYSVAWIGYALALLALGIRWRSQFLRYASLAVLMATVAKVFLYDMSDLTGLYRVASFLGLGLTLIGIGRVYRVFVFTDRSSAEETPSE